MNRRTPGSKDGKRNSRRKDTDAGTMDLFHEKMVAAMNSSFAASSACDAPPQEVAETPPSLVSTSASPPPAGVPEGHAPQPTEIVAPQELCDGAPQTVPEAAAPQEPSAMGASQRQTLPARMLNEFVYCPRLFYYEHVEGVFVESADTMKGAALHARVDKGKGALAKPESTPVEGADAQAKPAADGDEIHSRSVMLGSERLGVVAKMDLVEVTLNEAGSVASVCPVDYKAGSPREGEDGRELWDTDRMQLGLQCLVLRDNGYACDAGIIYYRGTKQRVRLELTPDLETWVITQIAAARTVSAGPIPPPLVDSPKCVRCSLAPVCLPDETRMLSIGSTGFQPVGPAGLPPRLKARAPLPAD